MDGQLGDAQPWLVDPHEHLARVGPVGHHHDTGDAEVMVQPRVPQHPSVGLDGHLAPVPRRGVGHVGVGLEPQVGAVGMGTYQSDPAVGVEVGGLTPRHERAVAGHHEVAWPVGPPVTLIQGGESRLGKPTHRRVHGVVRGGGGSDVGTQVGGGTHGPAGYRPGRA